MHRDDGIILSDITTPDKALTAILSLTKNQLEGNGSDDTEKVLSQIFEIIKYVSTR